MTILVDWRIRELDFIRPFNEKRLNSFGYDLSLGSDFLFPKLGDTDVLFDPFDPPEFRKVTVKSYLVLDSHAYVLGTSLEYLYMPRWVTGLCLGRSTYARAGLICNVTPLEAGWEGNITIEMYNENPLPVKLRVGEGITQVCFFEGLLPDKDYVEKGGRYQGQVGVTPGRRRGNEP